jgi:hypothetical protein
MWRWLWPFFSRFHFPSSRKFPPPALVPVSLKMSNGKLLARDGFEERFLVVHSGKASDGIHNAARKYQVI